MTTWLEKPADVVTFQVAMQSLPDGTDYPGAITLGASNIEVRITNSNYQKLAQ